MVNTMVMMKSSLATSYRLRLPLSTWLFGLATSLAGASFIGFGGLTTLTCYRQDTPTARVSDSITQPTAGYCTLITSSLFTSSVREISLVQLSAAQLEHHHRPYHVDYQVMLLTQTETIPLTRRAPAGKDQKIEMTDDINRFLQSSSQAQIQIQLENQAGARIFGFWLAALGSGLSLLQGFMIRQQQTDSNCRA